MNLIKLNWLKVIKRCVGKHDWQYDLMKKCIERFAQVKIEG